MKIIAIFLLFFSLHPVISLAEEDGPEAVPGYPGWTIELVQPDEDGDQAYRQPYYALKPPDKRPTASITFRAAQQLQNGELGPEAVYAGGNAGASSENKAAGASESGVSGLPSTFGANNNTAGPGRGAPSLYKAPVATNGGDTAPPPVDPVAATAASAVPPAAAVTGASSLPGSGGERAPASLAIANAKGDTDFQVGEVGKGTSTTATASGVVHACSSPEDCQRVAGANHLLGAFDGSIYPEMEALGYRGNSLATNAAYICAKVGKSTVVSSSATGLPFRPASPISLCSSACTDTWVGRYEIASSPNATYKVVSAVDCK